jgi:hypothetical protein
MALRMIEDSQAHNKSATINNERGFWLIYVLDVVGFN